MVSTARNNETARGNKRRTDPSKPRRPAVPMAATDDGWDPLADTKLVLLDAAAAEVSRLLL